MAQMRYLRLTAKQRLPDVAAMRPFKAIVIAENAIDPTRRETISKWLVGSGCLYLMAWGIECVHWHAEIQQANSAAFGDAAIPDKQVVISTWHEDETLPQLFWYAKYTALHPCYSLDNLLLLHFAKNDRERELRAVFEQA